MWPTKGSKLECTGLTWWQCPECKPFCLINKPFLSLACHQYCLGELLILFCVFHLQILPLVSHIFWIRIWGWCMLWGPGNMCFLRERNGMKEKALLQRFWWKSSLRNYPFRWQDYCQACYPCPRWRQSGRAHISELHTWAERCTQEKSSVLAVAHVSASGLFLHLHWGKDHSDGGTGQSEFYHATISQGGEQKHLERKQLFWAIFPPNQIFTDGEHDHLVPPYSWTLRTVCSVTFVWNCKEIKLRTVMLYILTVCLPDWTWVGLLWDLFWTRPRCHSDPGLLRSVSGRVLMGQFSENVPPSTCDWIPHPPPWMCYRPRYQPLPALCKIPVELF